MKKLPQTLLDIKPGKTDRVFKTEDFRRESHGPGAVAIAAKLISEGKTVSFDCYKRVKDDNAFLTIKREYVGTFYFGIASWTPKEITSDPVYIAAELMGFLCRYDDVFINQ